jgi:predicted Zn-dependent protease
LAAAAALGLLGNRAAAASIDAYDAGRWREASEQARTAIRWMPWSAQGWRLLGEAQLARGEVNAARRSFLTGLDKDSGDWELWLDLALASDGEAYRHALARASALNPRSPEIRELRASP